MVKSDLSLHQLLCPLAAISCTSAVTCNLEWGHLWLVSLATERGKLMASLTSPSGSLFHSYTHTDVFLSQQGCWGSQLCIQSSELKLLNVRGWGLQWRPQDVGEIHLFFSKLSDWALKALSEDSGKKIEYPPKNYAEMGKLVHSCANWTEIDYCGSTR